MIGAAVAVFVAVSSAGVASATAQEVESGGCIGTFFSMNCTSRIGPAGDPYVRIVPPPLDAAAAALSAERDRRWADRCRPVIVPDRYGVSRYRYAAPGCEFGIDQN